MLRVYCSDASLIDIHGNFPLSAYRRERKEKFRREEQIRESIGAELLLNHAVRELLPGVSLPLDIAPDENGKPVMRPALMHFSLSHSACRVLCAVSNSEVGADIQKTEKCNDSLVLRFFAPDEQEYIFSSADRDAAFTEIWCKKESYIKALGTGLKTPLDSFSVMSEKNIFYTASEGFHIAVCLLGSSDIKTEIINITLKSD